MRVRSDTDPVLIYQMLMEWGLAPPHLVVALVGGDEMTQMKPWLRDILRKGLVKAAQSTGDDQWANGRSLMEMLLTGTKHQQTLRANLVFRLDVGSYFHVVLICTIPFQ